MYDKLYEAPTLVVDSVIFQLIDDRLSVLLIKRAAEPFAGWYALPGAYCAAGETTREAMERSLERKAGIRAQDLPLIEQLYTFDTVARDPRGHAVSVTYMGLGRQLEPGLGDHTQEPCFLPVDDLPNLAYDHRAIIDLAIERLQSKIGYTNACFALLPPHFTLSQLQAAYEAVLGHDLDKRNFRKKFLSLDLIDETNELWREGAHRPAKLYRFKHQSLHVLQRSFD